MLLLLLLLLWVGEPIALLLHAPLWGLLVAWLLASTGLGPFVVYWDSALQADVPAHLLARLISLDWMCSFALLPLGLALVGPAVHAVGRTPVLVVSLAACLLPLVVLRVPGLLEFRTPLAVPGQPAASVSG